MYKDNHNQEEIPSFWTAYEMFYLLIFKFIMNLNISILVKRTLNKY